MAKERNQTLDIYKGLLIVLVVIRHVLQYSVSDEGGVLTNFIWSVQMPGFMLVSGYFSARFITTMKDATTRLSFSLQHYALPFFSWFVFIDVLLLGKQDRNLILGFKHLMNHVDSGLWFVWVIFVLSIIAILCNYTLHYNGLKRIVLTTACVIICFGLLLLLGKTLGINFIGIKYVLYYSIFYGFGYIVHKTEFWWKRWWTKISTVASFISLVVFLSIIYNFDLYHTGDDLYSIIIRLIAGFTGNLVILNLCCAYKSEFKKVKADYIGKYTLEIYVTSVYVSSLMKASNQHIFFELAGFGNFIVSLFLTILFTSIIILTFNSNTVSKRLFFGK